jgi:hypothetical protein
MKLPEKHTPPLPAHDTHRPAADPPKRLAPTEPAEVLGRHKNSGQKDHKGAR